ncbi:MAG: hypothetical protein ACKV19_05900 [Verrucomicrobiales bacterium]
MKTDPENLRALLDEVLPPSGEHCGPSSIEVLSMLHRERQRRRRLHNGTGLLAIILVAGGVVLWNHQPPVAIPMAQAPAKPVPVVIHPVNDEQLFALLEGMPAALMKLPNGDSRLLVIEQ